jgi:hypothetical protein
MMGSFHFRGGLGAAILREHVMSGPKSKKEIIKLKIPVRSPKPRDYSMVVISKLYAEGIAERNES